MAWCCGTRYRSLHAWAVTPPWRISVGAHVALGGGSVVARWLGRLLVLSMTCVAPPRPPGVLPISSTPKRWNVTPSAPLRLSYRALALDRVGDSHSRARRGRHAFPATRRGDTMASDDTHEK